MHSCTSVPCIQRYFFEVESMFDIPSGGGSASDSPSNARVDLVQLAEGDQKKSLIAPVELSCDRLPDEAVEKETMTT